MYIIILLIIAITCFILYTWIQNTETRFKASLREEIKKIPLTKTHELGTSIIGFNEDEKYFVRVYGTGRVDKVPFDKIISSEIITDGETVSKSSIKGAVIGGAIAGGIGAIIGSGVNAKTKEKIKTIDIKLTIDSLSDPLLTMRFYTNGGNDGVYALKNAMRPLEEWQGIFNVIIERNKKAD